MSEHIREKHDAHRGDLVGVAAQRFLESLRQRCETTAVVITLEPCGCINVVSTIAEPAKSALIMKVAASRNITEKVQ